MSHLIFSRASLPLFRVSLKPQSMKIGRSPQSDIVLDDPAISREHAAIYFVEGKYFLKRTGQAPLYFNGQPIDSLHLQGEEKFSLGAWDAQFVLNSNSSPEEGETVLTAANANKTEAVLLRSQGILRQNLKLKLNEPGKAPQSFSLDRDVLTIGAIPGNDLILTDPYCSSRHCKLLIQDSGIKIFDLRSTNGSFLNGVRVGEADFEVGQTLKIGQSQLSLEYESAQETPRAIQAERFYGLIGASPGMQKLYGLLQKVGPSEATVLILGESGTGKELVARAIHRLSARARSPFVAINCGAISPELIESELFGHEKGAFTGALRQHDGAFGQAAGGTLFLDEIGELPLELQPKLLRVLENRSFRRVGGSEEIRADVRVVAATHRNLASSVGQGRFREDLFFRLFVLPLVLEPLRQRVEDLDLLCGEFLREFSLEGRAKVLSPDGIAKLSAYGFPGNVRELKNVLLRAHILTSGETIEASDLLFSEDFQSKHSDSLDSIQLEKLEEMEKKLVLKTLIAHRWNKARAAEALGVAKSTLFSKIKFYQLVEPEGVLGE